MISRRISTGRPRSEALCWDMSMVVGASSGENLVTSGWADEDKRRWLLFACEA